MKLTYVLGAATIALASLTAPQTASATIAGSVFTGFKALPSVGLVVEGVKVARRGGRNDDRRDDNRGRGRGRGSDDDNGHRGGSDDSRGRGRGADDHPNGGNTSGSGRSRPRIPGGSGCDDAGDIREHPECRG